MDREYIWTLHKHFQEAESDLLFNRCDFDTHEKVEGVFKAIQEALRRAYHGKGI